MISHSLNATRSMHLEICEQFALDVKFNTLKSAVTRIDDRFDASCEPLILCGGVLQFVDCFKYLGVHIVTGKPFAVQSRDQERTYEILQNI